MLTALFRAFHASFSPPLRKVMALSLVIAVLSFLALWIVVAYSLQYLPTIGWRPVNWLVDFLGVVGVALLSWLLFPAVVTLIMGFFLERVAAAVEATDYPGRGPPRHQSIREIVASGARLMLLTIALNLLALPVYVLLPGFNIAVFLALNGYLFGRGYFEVVALRRLDIDATTAVRHRFSGRVFSGGVMIAGMFLVPLLNLVAPVIATAFMVHLFEALPSHESACTSN
ncbi:MAG TPA: EI24 domain-containing protein [Stellaceae bacterium]|nr:EI24 domain-containing protein [Stellaceae bacterium]